MQGACIRKRYCLPLCWTLDSSKNLIRRVNELIPVIFQTASSEVWHGIVSLVLGKSNMVVSHDLETSRRMIGWVVPVAVPTSPTRTKLHEAMRGRRAHHSIVFQERSARGIRPLAHFVVPAWLFLVVKGLERDNHSNDCIFVAIWGGTSTKLSAQIAIVFPTRKANARLSGSLAVWRRTVSASTEIEVSNKLAHLKPNTYSSHQVPSL